MTPFRILPSELRRDSKTEKAGAGDGAQKERPGGPAAPPAGGRQARLARRRRGQKVALGTETTSVSHDTPALPPPSSARPRTTYNMSCVPVADGGAEVCANCGKQGSDIVKLKNCTACRLVKYCGVDCQRAHRKQHKRACKQRAAELKDEELYSQGHERPEGDFCPICTLPIPLPMSDHSGSMPCCQKRICNGCSLAAQKRGMFDCAFCRTLCPDNDADILAMVRARVRKKEQIQVRILG
ncbi:hypothetical protein THAOC_00522 [Thalassiosira oceanica]|uniref:MYND-type domain-containing protein n=1 Tax=Thalassiosira oceanica TaxID=159749 RepID=K0TFY9_THAOC|nr:hypothetical protein THAOC_00522 [Thalassiosira oceanica]|eukprot:EJK77633.1 hypothetical protein THAOC_00522 [Thalassiosira oceanica]